MRGVRHLGTCGTPASPRADELDRAQEPEVDRKRQRGRAIDACAEHSER